mmetsp:Transcript_19126/g.39317  ORF Transcript_19126/g.39317 Transcript_19126/m.39317 type:complete len:401 (+) Transcript_19126:129-1331(+)
MTAPDASEDPVAEESGVTTDGGEVIYSDVGLAPIGVTKPPLVVQHQAAGDSSTETVLSCDQMSPQAAFEIFQGKVYNASIPFSAPVFGSNKVEHVAKDYERSSLPPLERLARLQQEVEALEAELGTTAADSGRAFDEQVVKLATDLKNRLVTASSAHVTEQDDLTRMIQQQLQDIQANKDGGNTNDSNGEQGGSSLPQTGLVYELYGNATNPTTTLEERLLNLERVLGNAQQQQQASSSQAGTSSSVSSNNYKSLLHRLEDMEQLVATVDSATLEKTATKAKVIRADLEAASKARNKLTATYKKEDSKMIQQLYQQMIDLEGLGNYLPNLVERLQQLSNLHQQASTFGTRLQELEREATQVEATVGQLEDGMSILQTSISQNIVAIESNMKKLDEKMSAL